MSIHMNIFFLHVHILKSRGNLCNLMHFQSFFEGTYIRRVPFSDQGMLWAKRQFKKLGKKMIDNGKK